MREFFHGWRRKVGCVTLLIACALAGMWMRSLVYSDSVLLNRGVLANDFASSFQGGIKWVRSLDPLIQSPAVPQIVAPRFQFSTTFRYDTDETLMPVFGGDVIEWRSHWQGAGFHFGTGRVSGYQFTVAVAPYWFVTMLLTLMSAYLLLIPSRKRPTTVSQPDA